MDHKEYAAQAHGIYSAGLRKVAKTPVPKGQKFLPGTFVWIAKDLGPYMSHFDNDRPAFVEYTYAHAYWGNNIDSYSLVVRYDDGTWSSIAWYNENQLTEITDQTLIEQYKKELQNQPEDE
jgi:hypothetical protein